MCVAWGDRRFGKLSLRYRELGKPRANVFDTAYP